MFKEKIRKRLFVFQALINVKFQTKYGMIHLGLVMMEDSINQVDYKILSTIFFRNQIMILTGQTILGEQLLDWEQQKLRMKTQDLSTPNAGIIMLP